MRNIEPWCISRQLWWGHRIPAWFDDEGNIYVEETEAAAKAAAGGKPIRQDEDVLDTWFSSGLWPFSTMGWPEQTTDLKRFYPTSVLVTGFDIIFFWVARMMMLGIHFMGEVPFRTVFINALVRDASGAKMSKSKGNVMDPLELVDEFGADALRFTLTAMSGQGRDIKLQKQRIEGYRNFGTKLWNAARFCQMNECVREPSFDPADVKQTVNRWIRGEALKTTQEVTAALDACAFDDAAGALYRFIWNVFCDWYLELAKPILNGEDEVAKAETRAMAAWTLDVAVRLLHPVMPFLTEELWDKSAEFGPAPDGLLISAAWPDLPDSYADAQAGEEIGWLTGLIGDIRAVRSEMNVPPSARPVLTLSGANADSSARLKRHRDLIASLGRLGEVKEADAAPDGSVPFVAGEATASLAIAQFVDLAAERARLTKELTALDADIDRAAKKLGNPDFIARAKEEAVEETREKLAEAQGAKTKLEAALARLAALS
jgi:valyl-tRNA synthetase